jgi:hypothetical protein
MGMNHAAMDLLLGAVDFHYHGYPEISFDLTSTYEDIENISLAKKAGLRGIVVKSHLWPTIDKVYYLRQTVKDIDIFSSITLNLSSGGVQGYAAETAARQGAKVIWLPTWSARHDLEKPGFSLLVKDTLGHISLRPEDGISVCANGKLSEGMLEVFEVAEQYDMAIATGHISPAESLAVAREAKARHFGKLVFSHAIIPLVDAATEDMRTFIACGGLVEFTFLPALPFVKKLSIPTIAQAIRSIGAENCLLSSDHFSRQSPPEYEMMRMFAAGLLEQGLPEADIRKMIVDNPVRLLY